MNNILDFVGETPLIKLGKINPNKKVEILAKVEFLNPSGSIKDRMVKYIVKNAEENGILKPGMTIVEPTSGNTGISFAFISAVKGYRFIAVMPEFASKERIKLIKHYGGDVILTPAKEGMRGAVKKAEEIAKKMKAFLPNQFNNINNIKAHEETTGVEILKQTNHRLDVFVAGVGTGGTLTGVAKLLKREVSNVKIVAVEPSKASVLLDKKPKNVVHKIEGIGEGFIPKIMKPWLNLIDEVIKVNDGDAIRMAKELARKEGLLAGISSGANVWASLKLAKEMESGRIVTVLPDSGDRYFSTELFRGD